MKKNQIPKTELNVSEICLGTMTFGSPLNKDEAIKVTLKAMDLGINFIDTANMYEGYNRFAGSSGGVAEEILGEALKGKRNEIILATKLGMKVGDQPEDEGTSPAAIRKHLELSLKRLKTDYVDIYYLHKPDPETPLPDILNELDKVRKEGKIRYYGISNYSAEQLKELLSVADENKLPRPVICQPPLSLLRQDVLADLLPLCKEENIAVAPYQILQGGLLTGKYHRGEPLPKDSRKAEKSDWVWELDDELFDKLEEIEAESKKAGMSMLQYAIRWALSQPGVVSAILGVKNIKQLENIVVI